MAVALPIAAKMLTAHTRRPLAALALIACASIAACAQPQGQAQPGVPMPLHQPVIVLTQTDWPSAADAARRAGTIVAASVPGAAVLVLEASAIAPRQFAMSLACTSEGACKAAISAILADREFAHSVEPDLRARRPARPAPGAGQ